MPTPDALSINPLVGAAALLLAALLGLFAGRLTKASRLRGAVAGHKRRAMHDDLTGLPNRLTFQDRTQQALAAARRDGAQLAVMIMDLDGFKEINDSLGHHHGDLLLREIGARLQSSFREIDTIARFGGDEFGILLFPVANAEAALVVADKIRGAVAVPLVLKDLSLEVDSSLGISLFPDHGGNLQTLLQHADVAMYTAKKNRSGSEVYAVKDNSSNPGRLALVHDMRRAIRAEELVLHYQPQLEMGTAHVKSVEAFVRWQHPGRGMLWPSEFLTIAESTNSIDDLTKVVATLALRQLSKWRADGLELDMSVNLSARNLLSFRLPQTLTKLLAHHGVASRHLAVEISEAVVVENPSRSIAALAELRALGVGVILDDFGAAQSSLAVLKRLPVTAIKIDGSLVKTMHENPSDKVIVRSIIDVAKSLGLQVVAEGVESGESWDLLTEMGCDLGQGYWSGKAMPGGDIAWALPLIEESPHLVTRRAEQPEPARRGPATGAGAPSQS